MAKQSVSNTSLGAAVCRLIEQYQPAETRLINDPVVKAMVGETIRVMMQLSFMRSYTVKQTDAVADGIYGTQICRTRYIDDAALAALSQGIKQLVILGAGLDTRAYRLPGIERVKVFEVDLPAVQNDKKKKVQKYLGKLPEHVTYLPIDFDTQSLEAVFSGTSFDLTRPAVFVWEGVTQYISEEAVRRTLTFIGKSSPGSILLFTYVLKSIIERSPDFPGADHLMDVVAKSSPWIFGLEPSTIPAFLMTYHLTVAANVGNAEYQEKYLKPLRRTLVVTEGERIIQATVLAEPGTS
jgi:methyltransferase (TIGR00027 family)